MKSISYAWAVLAVSMLAGCGGGDKGANAPSNQPPPPPGPPGCGLGSAAFCDTFDNASPGGRAGDLDDANWSVARISTMINRSFYQPWVPATAEACGTTKDAVVPDNDIFFCAGGGTPSMHMNDVEHDNGGFTIHSYRIRRPFDFTDRTGVIAFDVGAKGSVPGGHGIWFNLVISEEPVPAPYQQGGQIALFAKAAVVIEFEAAGTSIECPADMKTNSVSTIYVEKDYHIVNTYQYLPDRNPKPCFSTEEEVMNHVEVRVSKTSVEVLVSDAGKPETLRSIVKVDDKSDGVSLPLTKGYVNLQQTHYNAAKSMLMPSYATYHWDNIAFDGPAYPNPRAYEVPDSLVSYNVPSAQTDVGYMLKPDGMSTHMGSVQPFKLSNVDLTNAMDAAITLNAWSFCPGEALYYRLNGGDWRKYDCPFSPACEGCGDGNAAPGTCDTSARAVVMPVQLSDLKQGDNTLEFKTDRTDINSDVVVANAELSVNVSK
jgi:hypothetical protein